MPPADPVPSSPRSWQAVAQRLAIWGGFFVLLRLTRDFFFIGFMTFLFSYLALTIIGRAMSRLSPDRDRPVVRKLMTVALFLLAPLGLLVVGSIVGPRLIAEVQHLAGWVTDVSPTTATAGVLEQWIGPMEFRRAYHGPEDPKYREDFAEFQKKGVGGVQAYNDFPSIEAWVEGQFRKKFQQAEVERLRLELQREGTSSQSFTNWFLSKKYPALQEQARRVKPAAEDALLVRAAAGEPAEVALKGVRQSPTQLAGLQAEWIQYAVDQALPGLWRSPEYHKQLHETYDTMRLRRPSAIPYTFEQYQTLQRARAQGPAAFSQAFDAIQPKASESIAGAIQGDFEAARKHELFQRWWTTNAFAGFLRDQLENRLSGPIGEWLRKALSAFVDVPIDIGTALLLSFFICIDFPNLRAGFRGLRETWLRSVFDEIVPALADLGRLVARALIAQGLIALCNATMVFVALTMLGVEHEVLLATMTFVLCLIPTLGACIALVVISLFALLQFGGGVSLALKAAGAVTVVLIIESFVLSPRILGKMMELHPVLIVALLPVAQYFFGIWGLILAAPVSVYVINVIIFNRGLPGEHAHAPPAAG
ncbi:MAG: AI-2E family transporter [Gemmataceae bacterium]|nr:AI-2E family transporter [Gemmataceae bacterium]